MRFRNVTAVLTAVVFLAAPFRATHASGSAGFIRWAMEQSERFDDTWSRITSEAAPGTPSGYGTAATGTSGTAETWWIESTVRGRRASSWSASGRSASGASDYQWRSADDGMNWIRPKSNFIHKGDPPRFPLSARDRAAPSRGTSKLTSPANAHLGVYYDYRRMPNARLPHKSFFQGRAGKWKLSPKMGSRLSNFDTRGRGWSRPALRPARPRRSW